MVGLEGGVVRGAGVDAPGVYAEGGKVGNGAFVVGCYLLLVVLLMFITNGSSCLGVHTKQISIGLPRNDGVKAGDTIAVGF